MPTNDLSHPARWVESQRRSRARRFEAIRSRRRGRWGRSLLTALAASLTLAAGGALAQGTSSGGATATTPTVAQIQGALGITSDGVMGPQTRRAIKRFQRAHHLHADGVAGPATLDALGLGAAPQADDRSLASAPADATTVLAKIAACESGGDPTAISPSGRYRGKYQFSRATWRAMGGSGDPAAADEATQDAMAAKLYAARGLAPWPACAAGL